MGREDDGLFLAQIADELANLVFLIGVEAISGFVQNEDLGVVKERLGEAGAVSVALGESVNRLTHNCLEERSEERRVG